MNRYVSNTNSVSLSMYIICTYIYGERICKIFEDCVVCSMHVYVHRSVNLLFLQTHCRMKYMHD